MNSVQKVSGLYKSASIREIEPTHRIDKYDSDLSGKQNHSSKSFKEVLKKSLREKAS